MYRRNIKVKLFYSLLFVTMTKAKTNFFKVSVKQQQIVKKKNSSDGRVVKLGLHRGRARLRKVKSSQATCLHWNCKMVRRGVLLKLMQSNVIITVWSWPSGWCIGLRWRTNIH